MVYIAGGYFIWRELHHQIFENVIQLTVLQQKTFGDVVVAATNNIINGGYIKNNNDVDNVEL